MAVPFPEAEFEVIIYMLLGAFIALTFASSIYIWKLQKFLKENQYEDDEEDTNIETDKMGLSRRAEELINIVLEDPMLQSELPSEMNVSKATVSNAVSELFERNLIIKKKKANTYLIEPKISELEEQGR